MTDTLTQLTETVGAVTVPENGAGFQLYGNLQADTIRFHTMTQPGKFKSHRINIPADDWQIIGKTWKERDEETARLIVEWYGKGDGSIDEAGVGDIFCCYDDTEFCFDTAIESLRSLLISKQLSPDDNYIFIHLLKTL